MKEETLGLMNGENKKIDMQRPQCQEEIEKEETPVTNKIEFFTDKDELQEKSGCNSKIPELSREASILSDEVKSNSKELFPCHFGVSDESFDMFAVSPTRESVVIPELPPLPPVRAFNPEEYMSTFLNSTVLQLQPSTYYKKTDKKGEASSTTPKPVAAPAKLKASRDTQCSILNRRPHTPICTPAENKASRDTQCSILNRRPHTPICTPAENKASPKKTTLIRNNRTNVAIIRCNKDWVEFSRTMIDLGAYNTYMKFAKYAKGDDAVFPILHYSMSFDGEKTLLDAMGMDDWQDFSPGAIYIQSH